MSLLPTPTHSLQVTRYTSFWFIPVSLCKNKQVCVYFLPFYSKGRVLQILFCTLIFKMLYPRNHFMPVHRNLCQSVCQLHSAPLCGSIITLFNPSPLCGHLGSFPYFTSTNNATMSNGVRMYFLTFGSVSSGYISRSGISGSKGKYTYSLLSSARFHSVSVVLSRLLTSHAWARPLPHSSLAVIVKFSIVSNLISEKWYLDVAL